MLFPATPENTKLNNSKNMTGWIVLNTISCGVRKSLRRLRPAIWLTSPRACLSPPALRARASATLGARDPTVGSETIAGSETEVAMSGRLPAAAASRCRRGVGLVLGPVPGQCQEHIVE